MSTEVGPDVQKWCKDCSLNSLPEECKQRIRELVMAALHNMDQGDGYDIAWSEARVDYGHIPDEVEREAESCYFRQIDIRPCNES